MSVVRIIIWPNAILDKSCSLVGEVNENIRAIVTDLVDTCDRVQGFGLAAPQIGHSLQICVLNMNLLTGGEQSGYKVMINPTIVECTGSRMIDEGCLSIPGVMGRVTRAVKVAVEFLNLDGNVERFEAENTLAQAVEHEIDHLAGKVMTKRMPRFRMSKIRLQMERLKKKLRQRGFVYPHDLPDAGDVSYADAVD